MPGKAKDRKYLGNALQQRQEQQRARPSSTGNTSGGGLGGQRRQGVTVQFQPVTRKAPGELGLLTVVDGFPIPTPATEPAPFVDFDTARSPVPTPAQVGEEVERLLAPLPKRGEPLTPQLDALYRASRALADHIAEFDTITDGAYLNDLESALNGITTPDIEVPFTPAQTTALDLTRQLASDLAIHAHHSHLDELIRRIPELGTACGRAVTNALREAQ